MENWDNNNLPENHELISNIQFLAMIEDTWKRKKNDGTTEVTPKWNFISAADNNGKSTEVQVYSSTDKEELKLQTPYDIIVKRAVGSDGTFYGYSLKGFAPTGQPIPRKEPQSRFQKGLKMSNKAIALQAAATAYKVTSPDELIDFAEVLVAWLDGEYKTPEKEEKPKTKK